MIYIFLILNWLPIVWTLMEISAYPGMCVSCVIWPIKFLNEAAITPMQSILPEGIPFLLDEFLTGVLLFYTVTFQGAQA